MLEIKKTKRPILVMTGGGTAGHVIPNVALLPYLCDFEIHYIGRASGIERDIIANHKNITYHSVEVAKLRRSLSPSNLLIPLRVLRGIRGAKNILRQIKPDVVFSKGGFVAYPVVRAAASLKIPIIVHESDMTMGLANRMSAKFATKVLSTFAGDGMPIRKQIYAGCAKAIIAAFGFSGKKNLLVMGGSQGAKRINDLVLGSIKELAGQGWNVLHVCGRGKVGEVNTKNYLAAEYLENIHDAIAWADVVVSRAGATAACELMVVGKPTLFIPLSTGRGDQMENAAHIEQLGSGVVLHEILGNRDSFLAAVKDTWNRRVELSKKALELGKVLDGTKRVVGVIRSLVNQQTKV